MTIFQVHSSEVRDSTNLTRSRQIDDAGGSSNWRVRRTYIRNGAAVSFTNNTTEKEEEGQPDDALFCVGRSMVFLINIFKCMKKHLGRDSQHFLGNGSFLKFVLSVLSILAFFWIWIFTPKIIFIPVVLRSLIFQIFEFSCQICWFFLARKYLHSAIFGLN